MVVVEGGCNPTAATERQLSDPDLSGQALDSGEAVITAPGLQSGLTRL